MEVLRRALWAGMGRGFFFHAPLQNSAMMHILPASLIGAGIVASLVSNTAFGSEIGRTSQTIDIGISPRGPAFSIWFLIYANLVATAIFSLYVALPRLFALGLFASLLSTAAWVPLFTAGHFVSASLTLGVALACALTALAQTGPLLQPGLVRALCAKVGPAIFGGWLLCATTLGAAIAAKSKGATIPVWTPVLLAVLASAIAVAIRDPVFLLPVAWALAWMPGSRFTALGLLLLGFSVLFVIYLDAKRAAIV